MREAPSRPPRRWPSPGWSRQPSTRWASRSAAVYIGFGVADARREVITVEICVASAFLVIAAVGVTGSGWLLVAGLAGHGLKDLWQHWTGFVANTRWWPPFCATVDFVAAALLGVVLLADLRVGW